MNIKRYLLMSTSILLGLLIALMTLIMSSRAALASTGQSIRYVANSGNDDFNTCTDKANPCRTVQYALETAESGDEIQVASGVYTGTMSNFVPYWNDNVTATVILDKDIASLLGGFAPDFSTRDPISYPTTLDAEAAPDDFVVFITGTNAILDGFTITGSSGENTLYGAGIRISGGSPVVSHNRITGNKTPEWGAGIYISGDTSPKILENDIADNQAKSGAGIFVRRGTPLIQGNLIQNNIATEDGGGVFVLFGAPTLLDNQLISNQATWSGGGLRVENPTSEVEVRKNTIYSNTAENGAGVYISGLEEAGLTLYGNDIRHNQVTGVDNPSGGVYATEITKTITIINNVIADNESRGMKIINFWELYVTNNTIVNNGVSGVEVFAWPEAPGHAFTATLTNNIIAGYFDCGINGFNGVTVLANYNDLWDNGTNVCGNFSGEHNLSVDPQFVSPVDGDYHLKPGSLLLDSGTNAGAPADDKDGVYRPQGSGVDIGAYETRVYGLYLPLVQKTVEQQVDSAYPILIAPTDKSSLGTIAPLFEWQNSAQPEATITRLEMALDPAFTQIRNNLYSSTSESFVSFRFSWNLEPATTYYWHMWYENGDQIGPFSPVWSFTTGANGQILPPPEQLTPANNSSSPAGEISFSWSPVTGASEYLLHWNPVGETWSYITWVTNTEETIYLDPGIYEWSVAALNEYAIGDPSTPWQITAVGNMIQHPLNKTYPQERDDNRVYLP